MKASCAVAKKCMVFGRSPYTAVSDLTPKCYNAPPSRLALCLNQAHICIYLQTGFEKMVSFDLSERSDECISISILSLLSTFMSLSPHVAITSIIAAVREGRQEQGLL